MPAQIEVREVPSQPCLILRGVCNQNAIGEFLSAAYPKLFGFAAAKGVAPGAPFARYPNWREHDCDIEAGVILASAVAGAGEIESGTLGGGREVLRLHIGSYEGLPGAHGAVMAFVKENGLQVAGAPYEIYLDDCSVVPVEQVRTEVRWPVV